jgi:hypothetical protein
MGDAVRATLPLFTLRWGVHTDTVHAKAAQRLGFVGRNHQGCIPRVKRLAYQALVQPLMTLSLPAWNPTTTSNIQKLEGMHRRGLHFIHDRHLPPPLLQKMMPMAMAMHLQHTDLMLFKRRHRLRRHGAHHRAPAPPRI